MSVDELKKSNSRYSSGSFLARDLRILVYKKKFDNFIEAYRDDFLGIVAYTYEDRAVINYRKGIYGFAIWAGKYNRPFYELNYLEINDRNSKFKKLLDRTKDIFSSRQEYKEKMRKERTEFKHGLKVGDYLSSTWGYDQTNVDFYIVVEVLAKSVKIAPVGKNYSSGDKVVPNKKTTGKVLLRRVDTDNSVKIDSVSRARKWSGSPVYETPIGYGH